MNRMKSMVLVLFLQIIFIIVFANKYFDYDLMVSDKIVVEKLVIKGFSEKELKVMIIPNQYDSILINGNKCDPLVLNSMNTYYNIDIFYNNIVKGRDKHLEELANKYRGIYYKSEKDNHNVAKLASNIYLMIFIPWIIYAHNTMSSIEMLYYSLALVIIDFIAIWLLP